MEIIGVRGSPERRIFPGCARERGSVTGNFCPVFILHLLSQPPPLLTKTYFGPKLASQFAVFDDNPGNPNSRTRRVRWQYSRGLVLGPGGPKCPLTPIPFWGSYIIHKLPIVRLWRWLVTLAAIGANLPMEASRPGVATGFDVSGETRANSRDLSTHSAMKPAMS